jgi:hypothetical protein
MSDASEMRRSTTEGERIETTREPILPRERYDES